MGRRRLYLAALLIGVQAGCAGGPPAGGGGAAGPAAAAPTSAQAGATTLVAIAPPAAPQPTLAGFLGLNGLVEHMGAGFHKLVDCLGEVFPGLKPIPLPDELPEDADPGSEAAAEIKKNEEQADEKIAALKYLAGIGCGCYPGVEEAFLSALDDCTEKVRYAAVSGLRGAAGSPCRACKSESCCSETVLKKLSEIAYETDAQGCYVEPSPRVRRVGRLALQGCGGYVSETGAADSGDPPHEGPSREDLPAEEELEPGPEATAAGELQTNVRSAAYKVSQEETPDLALARVNGEPIWESEVLARIRPRLAAEPAQLDNDMRQHRTLMMREELRQIVDRKLLCQDARRHLSSMQIASLVEMASRQRELASQNVRQVAVELPLEHESVLAESWLARYLEQHLMISPAEALAFYRRHAARFEVPAAVRWERITLPIEVLKSWPQAQQSMEYLRARMSGEETSLPASVDISLARTETYGWTPFDELPSRVVADTLASLPLGKVSPLLRDGTGVHIVRVLQRRGSQVRPFEEVDEVIQRELEAERRSRLARSYLDELRQRGQVWSVFGEG